MNRWSSWKVNQGTRKVILGNTILSGSCSGIMAKEERPVPTLSLRYTVGSTLPSLIRVVVTEFPGPTSRGSIRVN